MIQKTARRKLSMTFIVAVISILAIGATFAWFGFNFSQSKDFSIATINLNVTLNMEDTLTGVEVGDTIITKASFTKPSTAQSCYVRASVNITSTANSLTDAQKGYLLALNYNAFTPNSTASYKWVQEGNYFYLTNTSGAILSVTNTSEYIFLENAKFQGVLGSFFDSSNCPTGLKLNVSLQAIQSANVPATNLSTVASAFNETFVTPAGISGYIIEYDANGGTDTVASVILTDNTKLTAPTAPTKLGYTFAGWYTNEGLTSAYNFNNVVTSSFTLYAKWTAN